MPRKNLKMCSWHKYNTFKINKLLYKFSPKKKLYMRDDIGFEKDYIIKNSNVFIIDFGQSDWAYTDR